MKRPAVNNWMKRRAWFVVAQKLIRPGLVSAILLAVLATAGWSLVPGNPFNRMTGVVVESTSPLQLDPIVYHFDGTHYQRVGMVMGSHSSVHQLSVQSNVLTQSDLTVSFVHRRV